MFESIILGLLQGLAEFLPISSSGHLVLGHELLGMNEAGMFFDIMLHAGTLLSIFVVFHKKITDIIVGCLHRDKEQLREAGYIILASIPTALIGLGFKDALDAYVAAAEYGEIEETISPEVLQDIASWIKGL